MSCPLWVYQLRYAKRMAATHTTETESTMPTAAEYAEYAESSLRRPLTESELDACVTLAETDTMFNLPVSVVLFARRVGIFA